MLNYLLYTLGKGWCLRVVLIASPRRRASIPPPFQQTSSARHRPGTCHGMHLYVWFWRGYGVSSFVGVARLVARSVSHCGRAPVGAMQAPQACATSKCVCSCASMHPLHHAGDACCVIGHHCVPAGVAVRDQGPGLFFLRSRRCSGAPTSHTHGHIRRVWVHDNRQGHGHTRGVRAAWRQQ